MNPQVTNIKVVHTHYAQSYTHIYLPTLADADMRTTSFLLLSFMIIKPSCCINDDDDTKRMLGRIGTKAWTDNNEHMTKRSVDVWTFIMILWLTCALGLYRAMVGLAGGEVEWCSGLWSNNPVGMMIQGHEYVQKEVN